MGIDQSGGRQGQYDLFLISLTVMCLSAVAIGFVLVAWAVGGQAYFNSFYGGRVLVFLAACLVVSAALFAKARKGRD